jgi:hypothetical protein
MKNESSLTAHEAVLRGHLVVTLPIIVIIGLTTAIIYLAALNLEVQQIHLG